VRARAILVTGAPGTGKSTLGRTLGAMLRLPFIARDDIRGGLFLSAGAWGSELDRLPSGDEAVELFLQTVEGLLTRRVSCVVEYVVRSHRPADLDRLQAAGDVVVVVTSCLDPEARLIERNQSDRLIANPSILEAAGVETVEQHTAAMLVRMRDVECEMAREFSLPVLRVDTTGEYEPAIDVILAFATTPTR
jgi:broad-specificity NMP kinase